MEIARYWRLNAQRYSLRGNVCHNCGKPNISERPVCDACGSHIRAEHMDELPASQSLTTPAQVAAK